MEKICVKRQILFSEEKKYKKNATYLLHAEFSPESG